MDTFTLMMIRLAILAAMVASWLVAVVVHSALRRRRVSPSSPAAISGRAARGEAANAASCPDCAQEAA